MASNAARTGDREKLPVSNAYHAKTTYQKVLDARKRPIRGLWIRGQRYYGLAPSQAQDLLTGEVGKIFRLFVDVPSEPAIRPSHKADSRWVVEVGAGSLKPAVH